MTGKLITACVSGDGDNEGDVPQVLSLGSRIVALGKADDRACAILDLVKGLAVVAAAAGRHNLVEKLNIAMFNQGK